MTLFKLIIKNIIRKKIRSTAIITTAILSSALIFGATIILKSVENSLETGAERLGADIVVVPKGYEEKGSKVLLTGEPNSFYMEGRNTARIAAVEGVVKASPQLFMVSAVLDCCTSPHVLLVGYDPASDFTVKPWIRFNPVTVKGHEKLDPVTIGGNLGYLSHDDMRFYGKGFRIGTILMSTGVGLMDNAIFMTMENAWDMAEISRSSSRFPLNISSGQISSVFVKIDSKRDTHQVAADIEKALPGVKAIVTKDLIAAVRKDVEAVPWGVMAGGVVVWGMSLVLTGLVFAMIVNERRCEFGIIRGMGATRMEVFRLVVSEAAILSGLGAFLGTAIGLILILNFKKMIVNYLGNIPIILPSVLFISAMGAVCIFFALLTGIASAAYPAYRGSRREPYEAIRQGK